MNKISGVHYNSNGKRIRTCDDRFTKRMKVSHDIKDLILPSNKLTNKQDGTLDNNSRLKNLGDTNNDLEWDKIFLKSIHEDISSTKTYEPTLCLKPTNNGVIMNNYLDANKSSLISKTNSTYDSKMLNNHINISNNISICKKNKQSFFNNNDPDKIDIATSENNIECIIIGSDDEIKEKNCSVKISCNNITFEYSKENWPCVLKMMQDPVSGVKIFESILMQKVAGQIVNNSALGKQRYMIERLKKRERHWIDKYKQLQIQLAEIRTEVLEDKKRFSKLKHYKRTIHNNVGTQANIGSKDLKTLAEVLTNNISPQKKPISDLKSSYSSDSLVLLSNSKKNVEQEQVLTKPLKNMCDTKLINKSIPSITLTPSSNIPETVPQFKLLLPKFIQKNDKIIISKNQKFNLDSTNLNYNNNKERKIVTADIKIHDQKASSYSFSKNVQEKPFCSTENYTPLITNCMKNVKEIDYTLKPVPLAIPLPIAATLSSSIKNGPIEISPLNKPYHASPEKLCYRPPPMPKITLRPTKNCGNPGVILLWDLDNAQITSEVISFEIYSYELLENTKKPKQWMRIGEVTALPLPMTCTLKLSNNIGKRYYFAVRAKDINGHFGPFSHPECAVTP